MNKTRGEIKIHFDGKDHVIKPTISMIAELEDAVGGLFAFAASIESLRFKSTDLIKFLTIILRDAGYDEEQVFNAIMDDGQQQYVVCAVHFLRSALAGRLEKAPVSEGEVQAQAS